MMDTRVAEGVASCCSPLFRWVTGGGAEGGKRSGLGPHDGLSGTVEGGDASRHSDRKSGTTNALTSAPRHSILTDVHGTPQMLLTPSGAIAGHTRSDVWGSEQSQSGTQTRIGHTGYLKDPILVDQLHAQARQYTPTLGRFTTRDPWVGDRNNPITLNKYLAFNGNPGSLVDPTGEYAEPGHYYATIITALEAGSSVEEALRLALYAQIPDEIGRYDAINVATAKALSYIGDAVDMPTPFLKDDVFGMIQVQSQVHVLNAGPSQINSLMARRMVLNAPTIEQAGIAIHALGDSFAHRQLADEERAYYPVVGHSYDNTRPDIVAYRPELFGDYINTLYRTLAERNGKPVTQEQAQAFADSMVAVTNEPLAKLKARVQPYANDFLAKQAAADRAGFNAGSQGRYRGSTAHSEANRARLRLKEKTDLALGSVEGEILDALRKRAQKAIEARQIVEGVEASAAFMLLPEENELGFFAGTRLMDPAHVKKFFERATPDDFKSMKSIYDQDKDANAIKAHFEGYFELYDKCWNQGDC